MKTFVKSIVKRALAVLMILIVGLLMVNKGLFVHTHKLEDGTIITHSHPYDKNHDSEPYKKHHHSKSEFLFFSNLSILFFLIFLIDSFLPLVKKKIFFRGFDKIYLKLLCYSVNGRAPPAL